VSDINEKMMQRLRHLEREVERLQRWERPIVLTDHGSLSGLSDNDHPQYLLTTGKAADSDKLDGIDSTGFLQSTNNALYFVTENTTWNFKPGGTSTTDVSSMSLSDVVIPNGCVALVEFDTIVLFRDVYGANIYLYDSTGLLLTFVAPMRMGVSGGRTGFHYAHKLATAGTYQLKIRCSANGSTGVDMDFLTRSFKVSVVQE